MRIAAVLACICLVTAPASFAAAGKERSVVGGTLAAATDAPWAVWVVSADPDTGELGFCSGSIIAADEVLTAAHCAEQPASEYRVWAGYRPGPDGRSASESFDQQRRVRAIRTHPAYVFKPNGALDDVAVFRLETPLDVSGPRVAPIALASALPAAGLRFYGYGSPRIGEFRGYASSLLPRWRCGGSAVWLCGSNPDGMACGGDSGGGLVTQTTPPQLVAVVSVGGVTCTPGGPNGYADVTAPEISRWIAGEALPPIGPRIASAVPPLVATPFPDGSARCDAGTWTGTPNLRFTFSDDATGAVLQDGASPAYPPTAADSGRTLRCVVTATNAGGLAQTSPEPLVVPTAWGLTMSAGKVTTSAWKLGDGRTVALTYTNVRGQVVQRVPVERPEQLPMSLPALAVGAYTVCLEVTPGGPFTAWRECTSTTVDSAATTLLKRGKVKRTGTRFNVTLAALAPAIGQKATLTWLTARCKRCKATRLGKRTVTTLKTSRTVRSPKVPKRRELRLQVTLPTLTVDGGRYTAGSATFVIRPSSSVRR